MNRPRPLSLVLLAALAATLSAETAIRIAWPAIPIAHEIDVLLKNRRRPEPLPLDLPNPFILPGAARDNTLTAAVEPGEALPPGAHAIPNEVARPPTSAEILADCVSRLRIGGLMRTKDHVQLVINDLPRKEGDVMTLPWGTARIQIAIVQILPDQVVLRYNDADLAVRF